jgi:hypothetical protein
MAPRNQSQTSSTNALEQLKYEVANEMHAKLGPEITSRENGSVGGEMTKRLVRFAEQSLKNGQKI